MSNRTRFDGLTPQRQRAFLRALTETGNYDDAAKRVKLSRTALFNMRRRYPKFAAACEQALSRSVSTLEQAAIDRAVGGIEEPVWHAGKIVGTRMVRSDSLLGKMLDRGGGAPRVFRTKKERVEVAEKAAEAAGGSFVPGTTRTAEEVFDSVMWKLERFEKKMRADNAAEARAQAERLLVAGKVP